jgi:hypothetical protein
MLLLALLPAIGRIALAQAGGAHAAHVMHHDGAEPDAPRMAEDCNYCTIQSGADAPSLAATHFDALHAADPAVAHGRTHAPQAAFAGLGSRGPPIARVA